MDFIFLSFCSSLRIWLYHYIRSYVYLWFKWTLSFLRIFLSMFFSFFKLSLYKCLLSFMEVFKVAIKEIRFLWQIIRCLGNLRLERVFSIKVFIVRLCMVHLLFYSFLGFCIKSLNYVVSSSLIFHPLDLCHFCRLVINKRLEC